MNPIAQAIPDINVLIGLEPEELGAKLLFIAQQQVGGGMVMLATLTDKLFHVPGGQAPYPQNKAGIAHQALREAWAWLEAQGLLIPSEGTNGQNGWRELSLRGLRFKSEAEFANYAAARQLPREALHPAVADQVWRSFMRGEFDTAVFQAFKEVEVAVRAAGRFGANDIGVPLMRKAFHPDNGPLTDKASEPAERHALSDLFAGAIGAFKNPHSHRNVSLTNPAEAAETVMFASYLLRVIDGAKAQ